MTNSIITGALARGLELHSVALHGVSVLSNHMHLLLTPENSLELSRFMHCVNRKIAFELNRLHGSRGAFWDGRYHSVLVTDEEAAQVAQLKYLLAQSCKEGLVASPFDWPGVHCARSLVFEEPLEGTWFHRTLFQRARQRDPGVKEEDFVTRHELKWTPLPSWAHLGSKEYRRRVRRLVREIEAETGSELARDGSVPLGPEKARRVSPFGRPSKFDRYPQPLVHAFSRSRRQEICQAYRAFYAAFRGAAQRQLENYGNSVGFPPECFPSAPPFVSAIQEDRGWLG